jgi:hypothetical protein
MMRGWSRGHMAAASLLVLLTVLAGCGPGAQQLPEPTLRYGPLSPDHCALIAFDDIVAAFADFSLSPRHDTTGDYSAHENTIASPSFTVWWKIRCGLRTAAETDRFESGRWEFEPRGSVILEVYRDPEEARRQFAPNVDFFRQGERVSPAPDEENPAVISVHNVGTVDGRWDDSIYLETVRRWDEDHEYGPASNVVLRYLLMHHNLVVHTEAAAAFPPEEQEEAVGIIHELLLALVEEAVDQLTLTTDPWPS